MIDHIQVYIFISRYIFVHFYPDIHLKKFGFTKMEILYFAMIKSDRKLFFVSKFRFSPGGHGGCYRPFSPYLAGVRRMNI